MACDDRWFCCHRPTIDDSQVRWYRIKRKHRFTDYCPVVMILEFLKVRASVGMYIGTTGVAADDVIVVKIDIERSQGIVQVHVILIEAPRIEGSA